MKYTDLIDAGATQSEIQAFLVDSENVPVTLRIPRNLRDSAKQAASLSGVNFTSYVKMCLIDRLSNASANSSHPDDRNNHD